MRRIPGWGIAVQEAVPGSRVEGGGGGGGRDGRGGNQPVLVIPCVGIRSVAQEISVVVVCVGDRLALCGKDRGDSMGVGGELTRVPFIGVRPHVRTRRDVSDLVVGVRDPAIVAVLRIRHRGGGEPIQVVVHVIGRLCRIRVGGIHDLCDVSDRIVSVGEILEVRRPQHDSRLCVGHFQDGVRGRTRELTGAEGEGVVGGGSAIVDRVQDIMAFAQGKLSVAGEGDLPATRLGRQHLLQYSFGIFGENGNYSIKDRPTKSGRKSLNMLVI